MHKEDVVHTNSGIYSAIKKNEIMTFAAIRMRLEIVIRSENMLSKTTWLCTKSKKRKKKMNLFINRNRLTALDKELMVTRGEGKRKG